MSQPGDTKSDLSRRDRLSLLRANVAAGNETWTFLNDLLQVLWGLPGGVQIDVCAAAIDETIAGAEPARGKGLLGLLAEVRTLGAIPGEGAVTDDALVEELSGVETHPVLGAAAKSFWPLLDAVDDRAFSQGVTLEIVRSAYALMFAVVEAAMDRHAPADDLARWRARRPGDPTLRPVDVPGVSDDVARFCQGMADRLEGAHVTGYPEPQAPCPYRWPTLGRPLGRCCGSSERHARVCAAGASSRVGRLLLERAVRLECGEVTSSEHLLLVLGGEPRASAMRIGAALVRRAYPLFVQHHTRATDLIVLYAEALGESDEAPALPFDLVSEIAAAEVPDVREPGARSFYWAVRALADAAHFDGERRLRAITHAVSDGITARVRARFAEEDPAGWEQYITEVLARTSPDPGRAGQAHAWFMRRSPSGVEKEELEEGWALVLEMLEESRCSARPDRART